MDALITRRGCLASLAASVAVMVTMATAGDGAARPAAEQTAQPFSVADGEDRSGKKRIVAGLSRLFAKVATRDTDGRLFVFEHHHFKKGGPPRHFHYEQDEWFYVLEGEYIAEVGDRKFRLRKGDSLFGPRRVPHAFAFVGEGTGKLLITFQPAGRMEEYFDVLGQQPGWVDDPGALPQYGFERVGPPLKIE
jgi:mannose-6-phosphate isomerase-like protein (cupin superfamily)